ncbi:MAG: DUF4167 domain-containing protein [Alphaproteobacteria bacterium]|nr:DUF4167 domain-containing protein [Alphaproteobacteria bacterium]
MRHGTSSKRQRSRNNSSGRRNNQQRTQVYDSNGPDVRIRGTAHQVAEKYLALAKDSNAAGDIIVAENYYQHAEHYIRIINDNNGKFDASRVLEKDAGHNDAGNCSTDAQKRNNHEEDLSLPSSIVAPPSENIPVKSKEPVAVS